MMVTVYVCDAMEDDADFPPSDAVKFYEWLQARLAEIPTEYLPTAKVRINAQEVYEYSYAKIEISYQRPETDAEGNERKAKEAAFRSAQERRELAQLAALQAKYASKA